MVKRIQNTVVQAITDIINLMLLDKGLSNYINRFEIHMLPPTTQEEIDRRDNLSGKVQITSDIMTLLADIEDPVIKMKILKTLVSNVVDDSEIITLIEEQINSLEEQAELEVTDVATDDTSDEGNFDLGGGMSDLGGGGDDFGLEGDSGEEIVTDDSELSLEDETEDSSGDETILPSPADLNVDMTDNNAEI